MTDKKQGTQLSTAIVIATLAHSGQFDKGGNPYILHPLHVLHKLRGESEDVQSAGVLHDVIEDCSGRKIHVNGIEYIISFEMLKQLGISEKTIDYVKRVTKMPGQTHEEYQKEVLGEYGSMRVKQEDLRHNSDLRRLKSRTISEKDVARVAKYMQFYAKIETDLVSIEA